MIPNSPVPWRVGAIAAALLVVVLLIVYLKCPEPATARAPVGVAMLRLDRATCGTVQWEWRAAAEWFHKLTRSTAPGGTSLPSALCESTSAQLPESRTSSSRRATSAETADWFYFHDPARDPGYDRRKSDAERRYIQAIFDSTDPIARIDRESQSDRTRNMLDGVISQHVVTSILEEIGNIVGENGICARLVIVAAPDLNQVFCGESGLVIETSATPRDPSFMRRAASFGAWRSAVVRSSQGGRLPRALSDTVALTLSYLIEPVPAFREGLAAAPFACNDDTALASEAWWIAFTARRRFARREPSRLSLAEAIDITLKSRITLAAIGLVTDTIVERSCGWSSLTPPVVDARKLNEVERAGSPRDPTGAGAEDENNVRIAMHNLKERMPTGIVSCAPAGSTASRKMRDCIIAAMGLLPSRLRADIRLSGIIICGDLRFNDEPQQSIIQYDKMRIWLNEALGAWSPQQIAMYFMHECYHVIDWLDDGEIYADKEWGAISGPTSYGKGGAESRVPPPSPVRNRGFLSWYAQSGIEEDKAEVFSHMIIEPEEVASIAAGDEAILSKVSLIRRRLEVSFSGSFDAEYWRLLPSRRRNLFDRIATAEDGR